ncbi:MAG: PD-(D/E)XK nuclease family protein [Pseudoflavonifractor sp.]
MLKLLIGRSGTGKSTAILQAIAAADGVRPQVLLVPEQHSHDMERRLCAMGGNQVSRYAEVLSFTRLAGRVFDRVGGLAAPALDAGGRLLLMYAALQTVAGQLKVYGKPSKKPEFLAGLIATVDELKSCCVTAEHLWRAGEDAAGAEGDKLLDLSLIYGAYEALTARQGADPRDRVTRLAAGLKQSRWAAGMDLYLDGFTDFTPQEAQVLRLLMAQANTLTVALTCDRLEETEGGTGIFSPARRTAHTLLRMAQEEHVTREIQVRTQTSRVRAPELAALEERLFETGAKPWAGEAPALSLRCANTPYSELEWTAAEILRLVREENYRFRDIAVTARSMTEYGDLIETIFARYGIPVFLTGMTDILQKPVLALITAALDCVSGNYQYDDLFRYLKTGLTDLSAEDCDLLENYALKWDLRGSRWTQKDPWTMHPRGYGMPLRPEDEALLSRLDAARRRVIAPLEVLRKNSNRTGSGQAIALYRFLEEIALPARLLERTELLQSRGQQALAEEYRQLWDILCGGLEQCAQILGDSPLERDEFARLFRLVLSQYDVGTIPVSLDRVTAGEMPRLAHKPCKVLFLVGTDDGQIPATAPSPGLLSDDDRSLLASYGLELAPTLTEKLYREMTIVYETCALPERRLFVSWAGMGAEGEEHRPAFFVAKLRALFPNLKRQRESGLEPEVRLAAPRPALELAGRWSAVARVLAALPEYAPLVARMRAAQGLQRGSLTRTTVDALYGTRVPMSASRMDRYKSCHFSYFMQYGLRAEPRRPGGFSAPEYGTFVHYVLEHVFQNAECSVQNAPLGDEERKTLRRVTKTVVDQYLTEELGGLENETPRFRYLFRRLLKSVYAVVENVAEELASSDFKPIAFELGFGDRADLPPVEFTQDGVTVSISGFVDRVDGWEHEGRLYLRVVDYKTGRKSFDLTDVWNGLGLQMLLYLFTLEKEGAALFQREIVPAGVLYLPARDAVIAGSRDMTEQARRSAVDKELRRRGLVLDDPAVLDAMEHPGEEGIRFLPLKYSAKTGTVTGEALVSAERLGRLETHIRRILGEISEELAAGNISADPFWKSPEQNACTYCAFASACHFEDGHGGDTRRWLPTVKAAEFWAGVEK